MKTSTDIDISPEFKQFLDLHEELKEELIKLFYDIDELMHVVKPAIEADYQLKIGRKHYELFLVRIESLRLKRKMEIIQAALNRQESCSLKKIDEELDQEFAEWQRKAQEIYNKIKLAELYSEAPTLSLKETAELKRLYRELAKKFHPDLNPSDWEEKKNFWLRIRDAYQSGDLKEMKTLALLANDFQEEIPEPSTMDKLKKDCTALKRRIQELIDHIAHIKSKFPFDSEDKLQDEAWVKKQNEEIEEQIAEWQKNKVLYEEKVEELIRQIDPPRLH